MIVEKNYPVYEALKKTEDWRVVYEGDVFGVFLPENVANKKFKQPGDDMNYYKKTLFDTSIKFKR